MKLRREWGFQWLYEATITAVCSQCSAVLREDVSATRFYGDPSAAQACRARQALVDAADGCPQAYCPWRKERDDDA